MCKSPVRFISFEGIDGAGKSSHIQATVEALQAAGHSVCVTREPGGTPLAESLRDLFLNQAMDPLTEALLVFAARRDHLLRCIEPALAAGQVVVCDRFTDATFAYQGHGRGFDLQVLTQLEHWVQHGRQPDLTLWFDVPPAIAAQRRAQARSADRLEQEAETFFERVRSGYLQRAATAGGRIVRIDAEGSMSAVRESVLSVLATRLAVA